MAIGHNKRRLVSGYRFSFKDCNSLTALEWNFRGNDEPVTGCEKCKQFLGSSFSTLCTVEGGLGC